MKYKLDNIRKMKQSLNTQKFILKQHLEHYDSLSNFYQREEKEIENKIFEIQEKIRELSEIEEEIINPDDIRLQNLIKP